MGSKDLLKLPLLVAAIVVVLRVIAERAGAPDLVSNLLSVAALHTLLVPLYLAVQIGRNIKQPAYAMLIKLIFLYAVVVRAMVLPTYWLARIFNWPEPRFYGLAGPDVTPLTGFITIPFATAAFWIGASVVIGGAIGAAALAIVRMRMKTA